MTAFISDPFFAEIRPWLTATRAKTGPIWRIELYGGTPKPLLWKALAGTWPCAVCGEQTPYIRLRRGKGRQSAYVSVTCPLDTNISCSRQTRRSGEAVEELASAIRGG